MDIAAWLRHVGLEQYERTFRENAIDVDILADLTDSDLEKLGVLLGHRKKLLKEIADIGRSTNRSAPNAADNVVQSKAAEPVAERRQLTVMFVDLVGSTALSTRLDPEDLREIIGAYHHCVAETITPFGGFVAQYLGDGALVYFGYPQAHENDVEQAVRAGLAVVDVVRSLQLSEPLRVRIGIATGEVIVGELVTSGEGQEHSVVGETPNLAARLQSLAEPDEVVISPQTRRLLGELFEYRDLGTIEVKGFPLPIHPSRVVGESAVESRFEALRGALPTPLVGREEEFELLQRDWLRVKGGEGRVILLSGEAGIGKSRLAVALQELIVDEPHSRLQYFCSPHHQDSALHPTIAQLERAAGFRRDDTPEKKLGKLATLLGPTSPEHGALLAELLSLPTDGRFPPLRLTPERKKEKTLEALLGQLEHLAQQAPMLMLFEDVHWIDPTSRELLDLAVERVAHLPVLLIITFRADFQAPWTEGLHVTTLVLNRLGRREGAALVHRVVGSAELPSDVVSEIVERTDGVPLFVEELTKAVLEVGSSGSVLSGAATLHVPATLHASLTARLDRLGLDTREVAQAGAVIGREFSYELLSAVAQRNTVALDIALDQLVAAGLAFRSGTPPLATFLFKHALVQDAAYGMLLRGKRQELHRRVATALEKDWPEIVETQPELLAQHCAKAGLVAQAVAYYDRAGRRAFERSAMTEANAQLNEGLRLLATLPDSASRQQQELELLIGLGRLQIATQGYGAPAVGETYARAYVLCEQLGRPPQTVPVLYGQYMYYTIKGPLRVAQQIAGGLLQFGEATGNATLTTAGHGMCGAAYFQLGEFPAGRTHLEETLARFDPNDRPAFMALSPQDFRTTTLAYLTCDLFCLGYLDQAHRRGNEAIEEARALAHPFSLASALSMALVVDQATRSYDERQERVDALIAVSTEHGFPYFYASGTFQQGWSLVESGQIAEGVALLRTGMAAYRATGSLQFLPFALTWLADAERQAKDRERALEHVLDAETLINESGDRFVEAELNRVRGELLLDAGDQDAAERCFSRAIDIARSQSAKFWELRAAISLAGLWRAQGKRDAARNLLGPVYGWFTEGLDTPFLKKAEALLAEL